MGKKDMAVHFGETLRKIRQAERLSQEELGARLGYGTANYISCLELGKRQPTVELLFNLAAALSIKPSSLIQDMEDNTEGKITMGGNDNNYIV